MANPKPTPVGFVVKNGLKMFFMAAGSMPQPRSITAISATFPLARDYTVTAPPFEVACAAFTIRL